MVERITEAHVLAAVQAYNNSPGLDHVTALRAALEAAAALSTEPGEAEGWRDTSTAPTNRAILIHVPHLDYYGNDGVYAGMLVDMGTGRRWMTFGWAIGRDLGADNTPDRWRLIPAAPTSEGSHHG